MSSAHLPVVDSTEERTDSLCLTQPIGSDYSADLEQLNSSRISKLEMLKRLKERLRAILLLARPI